MPGEIRFRQGTTAQWASANPVLPSGVIGVDTDKCIWKMGNGVHNWAMLAAYPLNNHPGPWSFTDDFNRANGPLSGVNYVTFLNYNIDERPTITNNQVYRPGAPTGSDWLDGTIRLSDSKNLAHFSQIDVATLDNGTDVNMWSGSPMACVMVRAIPFVPADGTYHYNHSGGENDDPEFGAPACLWLGIKNSQWAVFIAKPANRTNTSWGTQNILCRNARVIARGAGTYTGAGALRLEITGEDVATAKYKGSTLWTGTVPNCPRGTYIGFNPGGQNNRIDNLAGGLVT